MNLKTTAGTPMAVLDTNTALDWLVFADADVQPLVRAVEAGQLRWIACVAMREELARMLTHPSLAHWSPDAPAALAHFDRHVHMLVAPVLSRLSLRCSDSDDQVFIDLAVASGARWLVTHDRSLLKLARRARAAGVAVITPRAWCAGNPVGDDG